MPDPYYEWEEQPSFRGGSTDTRGGQMLPRDFTVTADTELVTAAHVLSALAILAGVYKGAPHPQYTYALCTRAEATRNRDDWRRWDVQADYAEPPPEPGSAGSASPPPPPPPPPGSPPPPPSGPATPDAKPPRMKISFRKKDKYVISASQGQGRATQDLDGKALRNSFGDAFDDAPPLPDVAMVVTLTKWYLTWSATVHRGYLNLINSDTFLGQAAYYWRIDGIEGNPITINGWDGWEVVYTLESKEDLWRPTLILDRGWNWKKADGSAVYGVDEFGQRLNNPVLLNGTDGKKLAVATPAFIDFRMFASGAFATIFPGL